MTIAIEGEIVSKMIVDAVPQVKMKESKPCRSQVELLQSWKQTIIIVEVAKRSDDAK
jgi:hypothetical protein